MKPLEAALSTLIGRTPTGEEIAKFYKIKEVCGFSEHDSVWALLLAFGHYEILYGEIPSLITQQTQELLAEHKLALEANARATEKQLNGSLADTVAKTVRSMADQVTRTAISLTLRGSRRKFWLALSLSLGLASSSIALVGWGAYVIGTKSAAADAAWLYTQEGKAARKLAQMNDLSAMLECPKQFQQRQGSGHRYCVPHDEKAKRVWGWRIK